jgi:carboxyl-terminal processing protease
MIKKRAFIFILILLIVVVSFLSGISFEKSQARICAPEDVDLSLFWQAWNLLEENFVTPTLLNTDKMIYGAITGMVSALDDPYTLFFDPQDTKQFLENVTGQFEGVGMQIDIRKGQLWVVAPLENTPAQKAGMRAGDAIIKIDDKFAAGISIDEAVKLIRGPKDSKVVLTVMRESWEEAKEIAITRGVIDIPSFKLEIMQEDIAYLKIYGFTESAGLDFSKIAIDILQGPADKIIMDLRNNPGGYLEVAQAIAGFFLKNGDLVAIEEFGTGEQKEYPSLGNAKLLEYPIVVLINQGSASGAEILAGALRDNRDIQLIGEKSFGKGSVQQLEKLRDGSSLKITIAKWLTPNGHSIADDGLDPDVVVEITEEDFEEDRDPQLDKALEIIKSF